MMKRLAQLLRRFPRAQHGVAAVEFALMLPMMLAIYIGAFEASALISMDRKVQSVSGSIGDLVARTNQSLTTAQMRDYFRAASGIMTPYSSDDVLQVVTAVSVDNNGRAVVVWSRQFTNGIYSATTPRAKDSVFPLPTEMANISKGQMVIVAEASYDYPPLFGLFFNQQVNLYRSSFFLPRFGGTISIL